MLRRFVDFLALWTSVNMIAWFTLWWTFDKTVTWDQEGGLLLQTSLAATSITLAVWGVSRITRRGSAVPERYASVVSGALDKELGVVEQAEQAACAVDDHVVAGRAVTAAPVADSAAVQDADGVRP